MGEGMDETVKEMVTARGTVYGRVQGVWFRAFTREQAQQLGVAGHARNQADGSVAFVLNGSRVAVEQVIARLHEGPRGARVARVEVSWHPGGLINGFEIG